MCKTCYGYYNYAEINIEFRFKHLFIVALCGVSCVHNDIETIIYTPDRVVFDLELRQRIIYLNVLMVYLSAYYNMILFIYIKDI